MKQKTVDKVEKTRQMFLVYAAITTVVCCINIEHGEVSSKISRMCNNKVLIEVPFYSTYMVMFAL